MCSSIATFMGTWIEATATTNSLKISCKICNPSQFPKSRSPDGLKYLRPHCRLLCNSLKMTLKFRNIPLSFVFGSPFLLLSILVRMPDIASRCCWLPASSAAFTPRRCPLADCSPAGRWPRPSARSCWLLLVATGNWSRYLSRLLPADANTDAATASA